MRGAVMLLGSLLAPLVGVLVLDAASDLPQPLTESGLPVKLTGVAVDSAAPSTSSCLIRCTYPDAERREALFGVGERACDRAEIVEIRRDAVVIKNLLTSHLELLTFTDANPSPSAPLPMVAAATPAPLVLTKSPNLVSVELGKDSVNHYLANLPEILSAALAIPRYTAIERDGQRTMEGFELGRIKEGSVVEQLGFRNGDVIVDVNGEKLDGLAAVIRLVSLVAHSVTQTKMTVLRGGRPMTFVFNVR